MVLVPYYMYAHQFVYIFVLLELKERSVCVYYKQ